MNIFVNVKAFKSYRRVRFYTFQLEEAAKSETEKFFSKFEKDPQFQEDLENLVAWLEEIGERRGALPCLFRFEESADALPPPARYLAELPVRDLRLYCVRLSEEIVILANGGVKTAQKVMDCPDLLPKFRFVRQVAHKITEMIRDNEFVFAGKTIYNLDTLEIEI